MSLGWVEVKELGNWAILSQKKKDSLIEIALSTSAVTSYNYDHYVIGILDKVSPTKAMEIFEFYCSNAIIGRRSYYAKTDGIIAKLCF